MKTHAFIYLATILGTLGGGLTGHAETEVRINLEKLGTSLGGWEGKSAKFAEYAMADNKYRTFKPDITPTPDSGVFVSLRIDYVRGLFASNDHAVLELTLDKNGHVQTTRSSVNIQGKRITSDLIASGARSAGQVAGGQAPAEMVVSLGSSLVANLSEKLSTENRVESGRVNFPSVVQHNFNLVYQAVEVVDVTKEEDAVAKETCETDEAPTADSTSPAGTAENEEAEVTAGGDESVEDGAAPEAGEGSRGAF